MNVSKRTRRKRLALVATALGLVVAACTSASEEPEPSVPDILPTLTPTTEAEVAEPEEVTSTTVPDTEYRWALGDCVDLGAEGTFDLPYAPYGRELLASCDAPHTHEVFFSATVPEGPNDPYPADLDDRLWAECFAAFADLMGFPSVESTLQLVLYLPDEDEWTAGERYHGCVLYQPGTQLLYRPLVGLATSNTEDYRWEVAAGTCYAEVDLTLLALSDAVPCDDLHALEMIGQADLTPPGGVYPGVEAAAELGGEACGALLVEYAAQPLDDLPVLTFAFPTLLTEGEWDAGARTVKCFAFAGSAEQGVLSSVGSLADGTFEIIDADEGLTA